MKKFLISVFIFCAIFFIIDKAFYFFMERSAALEKDNRLEKVITGKMNKDIILLGSSRGARDIIASQIEDSLQLSTYNLSYPGSDIEFHEFLLKSVLKFNKAPRLLFWL